MVTNKKSYRGMEIGRENRFFESKYVWARRAWMLYSSFTK